MTSAKRPGAPVLPVPLPANQPARFYRGGVAVAEFRGQPAKANGPGVDRWGPEDWVASTTTLFGEPEAGLSRLPDGRLLRDAIRADPAGYLGPEHADRFGTEAGLLVKLLDAGQRLPVHVHPTGTSPPPT